MFGSSTPPMSLTTATTATATSEGATGHAGDRASATDTPPRRAWSLRTWLGRALRAYPAATFLVVAPLVVGLASGSAWRSIEGTSLFTDISYGAPALDAGHWWGFLTGAFFVQNLIWTYLPILALLGVFGAAYERRTGHWQLLAVVLGGQVLATLICALVFHAFRDSGWEWAAKLATIADVGISAGLFVLFGAYSATMQTLWRRRARLGITAFLLTMVLTSGYVWDAEHLVGWTLGLAAGPFLAGRRPAAPELDVGRRTQRALVALLIAVAAVGTIIQAVYPGYGGPFATDIDGSAPARTGAAATALTAIVLLATADGLRRGHRLAWLFATGVTALTLVAVATEEDGAQRIADLVVFGAQLVLLLVTVRAFTVRTRRRSGRRAGLRLAKVALVLFAYTAVGFAVLRDDFRPQARFPDMLAELATRLVFSTTHNIEPVTTAARWFVGSIGAVWLLTLLVTFVGLLYSARRVLPEPDQDTRMRELLRQHESSTIAWMLTWPGNTSWFSADGRTGIGYRVVGSVALALGDPVGPPGERLAALREFDRFCFEHGWVPCLFAAGSPTRDLAPAVGWKAVQVAEDDVVPLPALAFKGKAWQDVRTAINKAGKREITLVVTRWDECHPVVTDQLRAISEGWVSDKSLPEMGFTLGTLREADDPEVRLHLAVDAQGTVEGFTSWMPVWRDGAVVGWCLDLMRRREDCGGGDERFRPVMEFLIGASALQFKEEGYELMSLSAAPLARAPEQDTEGSDQELLQKLLDFLGDQLEPYYGFRSLLAFKAKFQPRQSPMYLVYPDEAALLEIGIAVARAYMPEATALDWLRTGAEMATTRSPS
jgi:lysylphosphatidylglycerol synthetase-like protein (DUF2156 family)